MPLRNNRGWKKKWNLTLKKVKPSIKRHRKCSVYSHHGFTKQSETSYRNCSGRAVPTVSGRPSGLPSYPPASH